MKQITSYIKHDQKAFTLIEVLITLTIISLLTAIALPQYNAYKQQAFDLRALSDLRSLAIAEEAYFMQTESYLACEQDGCTALPGISRLSKGVKIKATTDEESFKAESSHTQGSGKLFKWDSLKGGLQE